MMTINDIRELIANDEHLTLELKKTTGELKDGMHTACAFLNTDGGWLIFGIAPNSLKIVGQEVTDATQREIAQALTGFEPAINVRVEYIPVPGKANAKVIAMYFSPFIWGKSPYTYHGCPYYKVESTTMRMPREMFESRLLTAKIKHYSWERQAADGVFLNDINEDRVKAAIKMGVDAGRISPSAAYDSLSNVLAKWHLLTNEGRPNNAAALLFGTNFNEYPQFKIQMARFAGVTKKEFVDSMTVEGTFFDLLDAGTAFFFKHLFQSGKVIGFMREEHLEIPSEALREALTNSLCHRQWEKFNQPISIAIFDDRLEISNPGILPPELPLEALKGPHSSFPYNPTIAEVLFQIKILEKWGTGVNRILDVCHEYGIPEPEWSCENGMVTIVFKRINSTNDKANDKADDKVNDKANDKADDKANDKANDKAKNYPSMQDERLMAILSYCMIPRSRRDILAHIGVKWHTDSFNRYIKPLLESGKLILTNPNKPSSPTQKYVTQHAAGAVGE
jgi:ATP-dependent DNA helicase RecG